MGCSFNNTTFWIQLYCKGSKAYLKITIKYFSWIRVKMKLGSEIFETSDNLSFSEFKEILRKKNPIFLEVFKDKSVKYFLNLTEIIDTNIFLKDGDEIAFLPPVTGG